MTQVGSALAAAHRAGVVHRDVKPANVFLDDAGNFYLGDFGIALEGADLADPAAALSAGSPGLRLTRAAAPGADRTAGRRARPGHHRVRGADRRAALPGGHHPSRPRCSGSSHDPIPAVRLAPAGRARPRSTRCWPGRRRSRRSTGSIGSRTSSPPSSPRSTAAPPQAPVARRAASTLMAALEARNPYKGLRAFSEADAVDFRGRARLVDRLVADAVPPGHVGPAWRWWSGRPGSASPRWSGPGCCPPCAGAPCRAPSAGSWPRWCRAATRSRSWRRRCCGWRPRRPTT